MHQLSKLIIEEFQMSNDPKQALQMSQYMRNKFSFYGIPSPKRKEISKVFFQESKPLTKEVVQQIASELYDQPQRELHYFAMELIHRNKLKLEKNDIYYVAEQITTNSWWDTVDFIATNTVGFMNQKYDLQEVMDTWNTSENIWLIRSSLIFQLKNKAEVKLDQLFAYILRHQDSNEFFIQKGAGWALRQASKFRPKEIKDFIEHNPQLPSLTIKEGSKYL